ncbi:MAG: amidohydrolase, partial [Thermoprotei archaeon]
ELLIDAARLAVIFKSAEERGLEVAVHAIGDGAIEEVLKAVRKSGFKKARIEHASLTPPDVIERIAELEIPVSVQPHFILSDWWITERLGTRRTRWVYAYKSLLARGVKVMGSSDAPVEPLNPWLGIYAAVDRGRREKLNIWRFSNQEALGTREALQLYLNKENRCLKEGEIADIAVIKFSPFAQSEC